MVRLKNKVYKISHYITDEYNNPRTVFLFFKALVVFAFIKMATLWSVSHSVVSQHTMTLPRSWLGKLVLAPSFLANYRIDVFFILAILFLVIAFIMRPRYSITILFFWLAVNLYVVFLPFANGADLVFFMLVLWCIPFVSAPVFKSDLGTTIQKTLYNTGIILCQLQIIFIYLISGWDKLLSKTWRSGEAFDYIIHLNTLYNPAFTGLLENRLAQGVLSWATIIFELAFGVFVWIEKTRLPTLAAGIVFHLFIWIVMSLPDFALIMMISYIIFLKDTDFKRRER